MQIPNVTTSKKALSPVCRASEMLYETIAGSLLAVAGAPAVRQPWLATHRLSITPTLLAIIPVGFHSKREIACSLYLHVIM